MLKLANDILTGKKLISSLTLDQCLALMGRFSGDDDVKALWRDVDFFALDAAQTLEHAQLGAKCALDGAEDDDEYWSVYGEEREMFNANNMA